MKFVKSLDNKALSKYISSQINNFFPDNKLISKEEVFKAINISEERIYTCFSNIKKKYFNQNGITSFNHLITDQYCMYLYMLANTFFKETKEELLSSKLYYLNKVLHSVDIYFTTNLSDIFLFVHPLGSILGRASFSDYFIMYQGCTVGCLNEGVFPEFKGKTIMYSNSQVLGKCIIGDNVCVASGVSIINTNVPDNSIVLGEYPDYIFKKNNLSIFERPPFLYMLNL